MRQTVTVERITCDLCGYKTETPSVHWRQVLHNGEPIAEVCINCKDHFLYGASQILIDRLNLDIVVVPLVEEEGNDE